MSPEVALGSQICCDAQRGISNNGVIGCNPRLRGAHMRRREFITLIGGGVVAWPLAARAQQQLPVIGFLRQGPPEPMSLRNAFRRGLNEAGIAKVTIEDRWAEGHYERLPALAAELVERRVTVIAAAFLPAALAAKSATQTIPIVFLSGSDPIGAGLVSSLNRPTGNVTGIAPMFTLLGGKNLELLHEFVPKATVIGALAKPSTSCETCKRRRTRSVKSSWSSAPTTSARSTAASR
jgi:putative ABC transport system substrate-binding protein